MSDWSNFKNIRNSGGDILKLEDGKSYKVRIIGEPYVYQTEYQGTLSNRFAMSIYNRAENKPAILMLPKSAFAQIYELTENEDWGDPEDYDITVKRKGSGLETEYTIAPSPKTVLDPDKRAEVETIDLDEILQRLPSVQIWFRLSEMNDLDMLKSTKKKAAPSKPVQEDDIVITDIPEEEEEIDLKDIPFGGDEK